MIESMRCNTCIHCHVCHAVAECTNTLYPCKDYEKERPHGEWIEILPFSTGKCSLCGNVANITNFCPNCGALMDGKDGKNERD